MKKYLCGSIAHTGVASFWQKRRLQRKLALFLCVLLCAIFSQNAVSFDGRLFAYKVRAEEDEMLFTPNEHLALADWQESSAPGEVLKLAEPEEAQDGFTESGEQEDSVPPSEVQEPEPEEIDASEVFGPVVPAGIEAEANGQEGAEQGEPEPNFSGSINGFLWVDKTEDRIYSGDEPPLTGYPIALYARSDLVNAIQVTATDAAGSYAFENITPGVYVVGIERETIGGQEYLLYPQRMNDNQFEMAYLSAPLEDTGNAKAISRELTVEANMAISGINGCVCLPQSPAPRAMTFNFSAHFLIQNPDGTPVEGIRWEIMRGFASGDGENERIHQGYTGVDGIIWYEVIGDTISGAGKRFAYSIYVYFPSTAEMIHAKGFQCMKLSTSDFWTHTIDTDYPLSGSRMVGWGLQDTITEEDMTTELHLEGPVVVTINGYSYAPTVVTGLASNITHEGASIEGTYDLGKATPRPEGCYFEYGTDPDLGYAMTVLWPPEDNTGTASANLTGLEPNTTYYYRICAENRKGVAAGEILSFKTMREITVSFDFQDGSPVPWGIFLETDAFNASPIWATYENPSRHAYDFAGWYTDADGNGVEITGNMIVGHVFPGTNATLYAKWKPRAYGLGVFYTRRDGEFIPDIQSQVDEITHGTWVTLDVPQLPGYVFVRWALNGEEQLGLAPSFTMPPYLSDVTLIYGYDRNMNDVEDFAITKEYKTPSGDKLREAETAYLDVGSFFDEPAIAITDYVYDHYEIDGNPSAFGQVPAIEVTAGDGDFTLTYVYKRSVTIRPAPASIVYGDNDPDLTEWILLAEGVSGIPALEYGSDYTLSIEEDPLNGPYRSAGSYEVTITPISPLPALMDYAPTFEEGVLTVEKKGNGAYEPGEGDPGHFYGTITIDPQTKKIGTEDPELTCEAVFEGLVGDDELSFRLIREPGETIGTYAITVEWEDSFPTNSYDVTAVKVVDNLLTIKGDIEWGELDPGMNGMSFDFGMQRKPIGTAYYRSETPSHTLRVEDNREEPTMWEMHAQLTGFEGSDNSSFLAAIMLENPSWECAWLNVEETIALISNDYQSLVMVASDGLESDIVDVRWNGSGVTLLIEEAETAKIHPVDYSAQLIWTISDAP